MFIRNFIIKVVSYFTCGQSIDFKLTDPDRQMNADKQNVFDKIKSTETIENLNVIWATYNEFGKTYSKHKDILKTLAEFRQKINDRRLSILFKQSKVQ